MSAGVSTAGAIGGRPRSDRAKADPVLATKTIIAPSLADTSIGDLSPWVDRANMHSYTNGRNTPINLPFYYNVMNQVTPGSSSSTTASTWPGRPASPWISAPSKAAASARPAGWAQCAGPRLWTASPQAPPPTS